MTIHKIPYGLPVANPTKAYWQTPPLGIADERTTPTLPETAKYVIVGSGISGALMARNIYEEDPEADIVMLEARQTCSGATGRNGGHCRPGRYLSFKRFVDEYGADEALRLEAFEEDSVKAVAQIINDENIKCDLRSVETCDIFIAERSWEDALEAVETRRKLGKKVDMPTQHKVWHGDDAKQEFLVPTAVGAISYPAYSLSPYKFVCALLHLSLAKGLNLQTTTPVLRLRKNHAIEGEIKWQVHTKRGIVHTEKVILATNAYTSALYPLLSDFLIPTRAQVAAIRPGSNISGNPALKRTCGFETPVSEDYMQSRAEGLSGEGDIIVGGGRLLGDHNEQPVLDDSTIHPRISRHLTHSLAKAFGHDNWGDEGKVLQEWTGIMGYTKDSQPVVGQADEKGLFVSVGFNGHGMALTHQAAKALTQIIFGKEKEVEEWFPMICKLRRVPRN